MDKIYNIKITCSNVSPGNQNSTALADSINIHEIGHYIGSSEKWNDKLVDKQKEILDIIKFNNISNINNKIFFRSPKISLPREKLNLINEKYKSKTTRDINQADYIITSEKYINSLFQFMWDTIYESNDLLTFIPTIKNLFEDRAYTILMDKLKNYPNNYITFNTPYYTSNYRNLPSLLKIQDSLKKLSKKSSGYQIYIKPLNKPIWDEIYNNKHKTILDVKLASLATEDSLIIDTEVFNRLSEMFKSNDLDNTVLGLEMMANSNIEKSQGFIALLFFMYGDNKFRFSKSWNHVNIKSIRTRFDKYNLNYSRHHVQPYDTFIKKLTEDNGLNNYVMESILDTIYNKIIINQFGFNSNASFKIDRSALILKNEYKQKCIDTELII